jgi:chorismate synthase
MGNTFGKIFTLTTFGESHGKAIGGIIDGCPAGISIDVNKIQHELDRRKPGQSAIVSQRKESDEVQILSGIYEGKTTGTPIGFIIPNNNQKSSDYEHIKNAYRPSHADFTYHQKYTHYDYRGGGRSSARETACRVVGGAFAKQILNHFFPDITIQAFVKSIGCIELKKDIASVDISLTESNIVRCPDTETAHKMIDYLKQIRKQGDTVGGVISCIINKLPSGWGEPVFDKLHAQLAKAMLSINAVKGFEYGGGFDMCNKKGSEVNDLFTVENEKIKTTSNYSGGIQGGISNGMPVYFNVGFKPVATLMQKQKTIDKQGKEIILEGKGRHDPCVVPRAVPIVEAMAAMVLLDMFLLHRAKHL